MYEPHVKGFTRTHPDIPEDQRGTYAGMAHPVAVKYLQQLGITAVELMPVHRATASRCGTASTSCSTRITGDASSTLDGEQPSGEYDAGAALQVGQWSLVLLRRADKL